jgi:preprotein translocase subunit SecD
VKIIWTLLTLCIGLSLILAGCSSNTNLSVTISTDTPTTTNTPAVPPAIKETGGVQLIYQADFTEISTNNQKAALDSIVSELGRRLKVLGASSANLYELDDNRILIYVTGVTNVNQAATLIGRTDILEFAEKTTDNDPDAKWTVGTQKWKPAMGKHNGQQVPLTSSYFKNNTYVTTGDTGQIVLAFQWTDDGSILSKEITTRLYNDSHAPLGIFSGNDLISAPSVNGIISDRGIIEGITQAEANSLRDMLNAGRLSAPLTLVGFQIITPAK